MSTEDETDIPADFFKEVTFYIVGDIAEEVRNRCGCNGDLGGRGTEV